MNQTIIIFLLTMSVSLVLMEDLLAKFHQSDYKIIFERAEVLYLDKTYFKIFEIKTFHYNRTQTVVNVTFELLVDIDDIHALVQVFKLSRTNVYRPFPIRFMGSFCDILNKNVVGLGKAYFSQSNPGCPLKKNIRNHVGNFYPDGAQLPPFVPTGHYKTEVTMLHVDRNVSTFEYYGANMRPIVPED